FLFSSLQRGKRAASKHTSTKLSAARFVVVEIYCVVRFGDGRLLSRGLGVGVEEERERSRTHHTHRDRGVLPQQAGFGRHAVVQLCRSSPCLPRLIWRIEDETKSMELAGTGMPLGRRLHRGRKEQDRSRSAGSLGASSREYLGSDQVEPLRAADGRPCGIESSAKSEGSQWRRFGFDMTNSQRSERELVGVPSGAMRMDERRGSVGGPTLTGTRRGWHGCPFQSGKHLLPWSVPREKLGTIQGTQAEGA
ncbi:hypothetical protein K456DRAFT_1934189, partial [Colletotrichum gloeosporioides 23]